MIRPKDSREILALHAARLEVLHDAYRLVRDADPVHFGGQARHRLAKLNAKAHWLGARLAQAEALAALKAPGE